MKWTLEALEANCKSQPSGCLEWQGWQFRNGYGGLTVDGKSKGVHRHAFELRSGQKLPASVVVRHTCDNKLCCRNEHLVAGTHSENRQEAWDRGRQTAQVPLEVIDQLRQQKTTPALVSATYGVTLLYARQLANGLVKRKAG